MNILGIHVRTHDTSIAFVKDGKIVYAASNERFSRKKMDTNPPVDVLKNFFQYTKITPKEIDVITYIDDPFPKVLWTSFLENSWPITSTNGKYLLWLKKPLLIGAEIFISSGIPSYLYRFVYARYKVQELLKGFSGIVQYDHHHSAHLHVAYYTSGWNECLVMSNEGDGFTETCSIYHVKNGVWKKIIENKLPNSMGKFYELITELLGFNRHRHAGKITGLSAFGNPKKLYPFVSKLLYIKGDKVILDHKKYLQLLAFYTVHRKLPPELDGYKREDLAAAFQKRLEDCVVSLVTLAIQRTGIKKIAIAGGVAANVKVNQRIHEIKGLEEIHIHQAMGDDGLALGGALHTAYVHNEKIVRPETVYFGPDFTEKEIKKTLDAYHLTYKKVSNIERKIAELIAKKNIIARFDGRMEYGPRALGNRSILYHTGDPTANDWLNKRLKRTEFMPFAPVTLEEYADKCFVGTKGAKYPAKFMTITFQCTPYMKKVSPAVVHVDGTARPQLIRKVDNPSYYKIVSEYHKITGIPTLVNTSFNMHEEPIVCTPEDAVRSFLHSSVDYLAIGSFLLHIEDNKKQAQKYKNMIGTTIKKKNAFQTFIDFVYH